MPTLPFPASVIDFAGIYQRIPNFTQVRDAGVRRCILRMGDGRTQDPYFLYNLEGSMLLPDRTEAYWEFRPSLDPSYHAEILYVALAGAGWGSVRTLWLACELSDGYSAGGASWRLDKCVALLEAELQGRVEIAPYTSRYKWQFFAYSKFLQGRRLWVADYGWNRYVPVYTSANPRLPAGATSWYRWQKWDRGLCPGIVGSRVDLNEEQV